MQHILLQSLFPQLPTMTIPAQPFNLSYREQFDKLFLTKDCGQKCPVKPYESRQKNPERIVEMKEYRIKESGQRNPDKRVQA